MQVSQQPRWKLLDFLCSNLGSHIDHFYHILLVKAVTSLPRFKGKKPQALHGKCVKNLQMRLENHHSNHGYSHRRLSCNWKWPTKADTLAAPTHVWAHLQLQGTVPMIADSDSVPSQSPGLTVSQTKGFRWEVAQPSQAALNQWDQVSRHIPNFPVP